MSADQLAARQMVRPPKPESFPDERARITFRLTTMRAIRGRRWRFDALCSLDFGPPDRIDFRPGGRAPFFAIILNETVLS